MHFAGEDYEAFCSHMLYCRRRGTGARHFCHTSLHRHGIKGKRGFFMGVTLNPDKKIVDVIKEGLERTGGYCPCRRERTPETKCMCEEFRNQIADPDFEGFCHCMLYYKTKE